MHFHGDFLSMERRIFFNDKELSCQNHRTQQAGAGVKGRIYQFITRVIE
jgi:hypothetical protein